MPPLTFDSYSTVSILPCSIPSRLASNPAGADANAGGCSCLPSGFWAVATSRSAKRTTLTASHVLDCIALPLSGIEVNIVRKSRPLRVDAVLLFACVSTSGGSSTHRGRVLDQAAQKPEQRLA